jgi:L-rhamnose mutarotase
LINKKPEERNSKFDLTNFELEPDFSKFISKREKKAYQKRMPLVKPVCLINKSSTYAKKMFEVFRVEKDQMGSLKQGSLMKLNDFVNPILMDLDPDQGVEEEYKKKHDQTFCWRFLRAVSYIDQQCF